MHASGGIAHRKIQLLASNRAVLFCGLAAGRRYNHPSSSQRTGRKGGGTWVWGWGGCFVFPPVMWQPPTTSSLTCKQLDKVPVDTKGRIRCWAIYAANSRAMLKLACV
jgi:hypothetical protein